MITVINCFLAVNKQGGEGEAESIDIGTPAIDKDYGVSGGDTAILIDNPANFTGMIQSIEIWASINITGLIIAIFQQVSPDVFTARSNKLIGDVVAGEKRIFEVNLNVTEGDFLGAYWDSGAIEADSDGPGLWYHEGNQTSCVGETFEFIEDWYVSLYGIGLTIVPKTYTKIDCDLHVNANDDNFFGRLIRCDLEVKRDLVNACLGIVTPAEGQPGGGIQQSIRLKITIDSEDVSHALVGQVMIQHNENLISTFSFNLGDFQYSPLLAGDYEDKEVVITSYVNGKEVRLFTGLIDGTRSDKSDKYNLNIYGSCYGKKLLKRMTLISVQEAATAKTRGAIIRYLAGQAGITNMDVPTGSKTEIDHSFQDQFIWDMIQKEMMIEGWVIRFDENRKMLVYKKVIKTDEIRYPTPDWEYGEDQFILLGLNTTREGIINQITILGAIFEEEVFTVETEDPEGNVWGSSISVPKEEYSEDSGNISKDFNAGESVTAWSYNDGNFRVFAKYLGSSKSPYVTYTQYQDYQFTVENLIGSHLIKNIEVSVSGGAVIYSQGSTWFKVHRLITDPIEWDFTEMAFSVSITVYYKELTGGGAVWITENLPNENVVSTITHTQIKAIVSDPASIAKYGERKPNEEGTEEYPLAETEAQCIDIGQRRIRDSHRYIKQPDFQVNLNPKMLVGECVNLTDKKIGYNGRWYLEEVVHYFDIDPETGAIKPRTRIGCVFYA